MLVQWSLIPSLQTHLQEVKTTGLFLVFLYTLHVSAAVPGSGRAVSGHVCQGSEGHSGRSGSARSGDHPGLAVWDPPGCRGIATAEGG